MFHKTLVPYSSDIYGDETKRQCDVSPQEDEGSLSVHVPLQQLRETFAPLSFCPTANASEKRCRGCWSLSFFFCDVHGYFYDDSMGINGV